MPPRADRHLLAGVRQEPLRQRGDPPFQVATSGSASGSRHRRRHARRCERRMLLASAEVQAHAERARSPTSSKSRWQQTCARKATASISRWPRWWQGFSVSPPTTSSAARCASEDAGNDAGSPDSRLWRWRSPDLRCGPRSTGAKPWPSGPWRGPEEDRRGAAARSRAQLRNRQARRELSRLRYRPGAARPAGNAHRDRAQNPRHRRAGHRKARR